jgi:hypothetical protein
MDSAKLLREYQNVFQVYRAFRGVSVPSRAKVVMKPPEKYAEGLNRGLGFEALGDPERILQSLNAGTGGALCFGLRQMPGYLRIDVLHPKQLVIYKLQHCLQLFEGELNSYFLHPDELILPRLLHMSYGCLPNWRSAKSRYRSQS